MNPKPSRSSCISMYQSLIRLFHQIILFIILISLESTNNQPNGFINNSPLLDSFIRYYMIFLNIYFLFDLFTAVIAKGLTSDRNAYLSNPINTLNALLLIFVTIFQYYPLNIFRILYLVELISNHRYFLHIQHISAMAKQSFTNMF